MKKLLPTILATIALSLLVPLAGCGEAEEPLDHSNPPTDSGATSAQPLDDGNPAPTGIDPATGQTEPGEMGLPGNKGGG